MSKLKLPKEFKLGNELFTLVYFPDPKNLTQIEPNFMLMQSFSMDCTKVLIPQNGRNIEMYMSWARTFIPGKGTEVPQKNFLLFTLQDKLLDPAYIATNSMICYAVQDLSQSGASVQQNFINQLFNIDLAVEKNVDKDWASNIFESPVNESVEVENEAGTS